MRQSRDPLRRPRRIFTETGRSTASATDETMRQASAGSSSSVAPAPGLRHLAHRAAEVDVDDVRACVFDHSRRFRHRAGIGAKDLDRQGMLVGGDPEVTERLLVAVLDSRTRDHLGADEPRAEPAPLPPECLHADSRHRRENESSRHLDGVDEPAFPEVDLHHVMVDGCSLRAGCVGSYPSRPS